MGEIMIVAGMGYRKGISAAQVEAAIDAALQHSRRERRDLASIAVPAVKSTEAAIAAVAAARGIPLALITREALEAADARTMTRSLLSMDALNVRSVAEAAALAGAGPNSRLLAPRVAVGPVTCALAEGETR